MSSSFLPISVPHQTLEPIGEVVDIIDNEESFKVSWKKKFFIKKILQILLEEHNMIDNTYPLRNC